MSSSSYYITTEAENSSTLPAGPGWYMLGVPGTFADGTPWPMAGVILISGVCCLLSMSLLSR